MGEASLKSYNPDLKVKIHVNVQHKVSACSGAVIGGTYKGYGQYKCDLYGTIVSLQDHQVCMGPSCACVYIHVCMYMCVN